jgi:hypothetical protein
LNGFYCIDYPGSVKMVLKGFEGIAGVILP